MASSYKMNTTKSIQYIYRISMLIKSANLGIIMMPGILKIQLKQ